MKLYALNVRWLDEDHTFSMLLNFVSEDRRKKTLAFRYAKDRALSLGAGLLLNLAIAREAPGMRMPPEIRMGEYGRPFLAENGAPSYSLSHSGEYAVCAIGPETVGVDIEKIGTADEAVARRCFLTSELQRVMRDGTVNAERFYSLWTLKESYIKFIGTGLSLDPLRFEILDTHPMRVMREGVEMPCHFKLYEELAGYKLALCMESDHFPDRAHVIGEEELRDGIRC